MRACALHDYIVSRRIVKLAGQIDIIHAWPLGSLRTLKVAAELGIPTVLERPNTHTRYGYKVVQRECDRLGIILPPGDNHLYNRALLAKEELEYEAAYKLLCPSELVAQTFSDYGFSREKLARHSYGFDTTRFFPQENPRLVNSGFTLLFVGVCNVVKGLHFALEAWLKSPVHKQGKFLIVGDFAAGYAEKLSAMLSEPSVSVLGHQSDVSQLMRSSDALILPSLTEGFALVCAEAMGSGLVPLVSTACTELCRNRENSLVHQIGDVATIAEHISLLDSDRVLLERLRSGALATAPEVTWERAGLRLRDVYIDVVKSYRCSHGVL